MDILESNILNLSKKQIQSFQQSTGRINLWIGSVRSGKSFVSVLRFLDFLLNGPDGEYAVCGQSRQALERNILPLLNHFLGSKFTFLRGRNELYIFGKKIYVIGANDIRAEYKIRGSTLAGAYVDEITILPESFFVVLLQRLSVKGAQLFGTTNPDSPFHWLKKNYIDAYETQDLRYFNFTLEDNPHLHEEYKKNIKAEHKGLYYKRFIEGLWVLAEGAIFDFFDEKIHTIQHAPTRNAKYIVGVDYGTTNPTAFALIGYSSDTYPRIWLEKEYYWDSKAQNRQKTDSEYVDDLLNFIDLFNVSDIYIDPSAVSYRVALSRATAINLTSGSNAVLDGVRHHSRLLGDGTFKICSHCTQTIHEYHSYSWDPRASRNGIDRPLKENDHLMDAIRYALYTHFHQNEDEGSLSPADLERMRSESLGLTRFGKFFDGYGM